MQKYIDQDAGSLYSQMAVKNQKLPLYKPEEFLINLQNAIKLYMPQ
jgi:hypothetical protein